MDHCLNCGGAIGEPGIAYGYAGKWCRCPVVQWQRPASAEWKPGLDVNRATIHVMGYSLMELEKIIAFAIAHGYEKTASPKECDND